MVVYEDENYSIEKDENKNLIITGFQNNRYADEITIPLGLFLDDDAADLMEDIQTKLFVYKRDKIIKNLDRYKNFIFPSKPVDFNFVFGRENIDTVNIHDLTLVDGKDIVGFAGAFSLQNGKVLSLDGDSYTTDMKVFGYHRYTQDGRKCLDILVEDW